MDCSWTLIWKSTNHRNDGTHDFFIHLDLLLFVFIFLFNMLFLISSITINTISYFAVKCPEKREKIVVGKVIVAKAIRVFSLYIGRIRFELILYLKLP
jgi:hypothetical protein